VERWFGEFASDRADAGLQLYYGLAECVRIYLSLKGYERTGSCGTWTQRVRNAALLLLVCTS
jgi:hypothetical protein